MRIKGIACEHCHKELTYVVGGDSPMFESRFDATTKREKSRHLLECPGPVVDVERDGLP